MIKKTTYFLKTRFKNTMKAFHIQNMQNVKSKDIEGHSEEWQHIIVNSSEYTTE